MTFVGKIFIMLIFIMSLVFMAFAVMVYATHKNWYAVVENPISARPPGLKAQLQESRSQLEAARTTRLKIEADLADEKSQRIREVAELRTKYQQVREERDSLQKAEAKLQEQLRESTETMNATQNTLAGLRDEIKTLRESNDKARKDRDKALADSVKFEDELAQAKGEVDRLGKRSEQLATDLAVYSQRLQDAGVPLQADQVNLKGVVKAISANDFMELSLGSDDGLQAGDRLEVFRLGSDGSKYLGRCTVIRVEVDKAVARLIAETKRAAVQVGDRVATRLEQSALPENTNKK